MFIFSVGLFICWATSIKTDVSPVFLTPYINNNTINEGRNSSIVDPKEFLGVSSHSGYITVDAAKESNLFFWYFPVPDADVKDTPLIIWLQGGPGGTSLVGAFLEIGPFAINGSELISRPSSWGRNHSLLFIDNPVGSGLSFTKGEYDKNLDDIATHLYSFLQQFMTVFPELRSAPLFIAGESYAGRYVPAFAKKVHDSVESHDGDKKINLQGIIMGNPVLNYKDSANFSQIFYHWGLIDTQGVMSAKKLQDEYTEALNNNDPNANILRNELLDRLQDISHQLQLYNVVRYDALNTSQFLSYINTMKFKEAVHGTDKYINLVEREVQRPLASDFLRNMDSTMTLLLEHYRVLIYCGQLDLTEPCVPNSEARRRNWQWSGRDQFMNAHRKPLKFFDTVAGYIKSGGGLTEVLVVGAGHLVPIDKPKEAQLLISYFVKGKEPPTYTSTFEFNDIPDLDVGTTVGTHTTDNVTTANNSNVATVTDTGNPWNIISWVLNGFLMFLIVVCGVLYIRHRRQYRDYLLNDDDSLSNAVLSMS